MPLVDRLPVRHGFRFRDARRVPAAGALGRAARGLVLAALLTAWGMLPAARAAGEGEGAALDAKTPAPLLSKELDALPATVSLPEAKGPLTAILTGRDRYEGREWLRKDGHWYFFADVEEIMTASEKGRIMPHPRANGGKFYLCYPPHGSITMEVEVPQTAEYSINLRFIFHGNFPPAFRLLVDGEEAFRSTGPWWWRRAGKVRLEKGRHTIRLIEDGTRNLRSRSNRLLQPDVIQLTTDPKSFLSNEMTTNPYDPDDSRWLRRTAVSSADLRIVAGAKTLALGGVLPHDRCAVLFPDGEVRSAERLEADGDWSGPGGRLLRIEDGDGSSHRLRLDVFALDARPTEVTPARITPNGDLHDDVAAAPALRRGLSLVRRLPALEPVRDLRARSAPVWGGRDAEGVAVPGGSYILVSERDENGDPVRWGLVEVEADARPLAWTETPVVTPNGDGVCDAAAILFRPPASWRGEAVVLGPDGAERATLAPARDWPADKPASVLFPAAEEGKHDPLGPPVRSSSPEPGTYTIAFRPAGDGDGEAKGGAIYAGVRVEVSDASPWPAYRYTGRAGLFPYGVCMSGTPNERQLDILRQQHCNTAMCWGWPSPEELDLCAEKGVHVIGHMGILTEYDEAAAKAYYENKTEGVRGHTALLGYYILDEPGINPKLVKWWTLAQTVLGALDPRAAVLGVLIGQNRIDYYSQRCDPSPFFLDIYPLHGTSGHGDFSNMYATRVPIHRYVEESRTNVTSWDRPFWVILQAHGFGNWHREPIPAEMRSMAWLMLGQEARSITWFYLQSQQTWRGLIHEGEITDRFRTVARLGRKIEATTDLLLDLYEDRSLASVLTDPLNRKTPPEARCHRDGEGRLFLFVTNTHVESEARTLLLLDDAAGEVRELRDAMSGERHRVRKSGPFRTVELVFEPGEGRLFEAVGAAKRPQERTGRRDLLPLFRANHAAQAERYRKAAGVLAGAWREAAAWMADWHHAQDAPWEAREKHMIRRGWRAGPAAE